MSMGLKANADGSGAVQVGGSDAITITSGLAVSLPTGNFAFNSGYGSAATAYGCRAWVNFNGTGTVAIRASGNVTSITDTAVSRYTVNFTTAMPDANYTATVTIGNGTTAETAYIVNAPRNNNPTTTAFEIQTFNNSLTGVDCPFVQATFFR